MYIKRFDVYLIILVMERANANHLVTKIFTKIQKR